MAIGDGADVGDVYLEGHLEYDPSHTPAFMAALRRDMQRRLPDIAKDINKEFSSSVEKGLTDGGNKGMSALEKRLKSLNLKMPDLNVPVEKALRDLDAVQQKVAAIHRTSGSATTTVDSAKAFREIDRIKGAISQSIQLRPEIDIEKDREKYHNIGKAIGLLLSAGAGMGLKEHARFIRDAMVVVGAAAAGAAVVGMLGVIQAAIAIVPAAIAAAPSLFFGLAGAVGVAFLALEDFVKLFNTALHAFEDIPAAVELINKEMAHLVPQAREFFIELAQGSKAFDDLRAIAQNEFYIPLKDNAAGIILLFQTLREEVGGVANSLGTLASRFMNVATSASSLHAFEKVMQGTKIFLDTVAPALARFFDAVIQKAGEGAEHAETFGKKIASIFDWMTNWLNTHSLKQLFEDAKPAIEDLKRIGEALWGTLKNLFGGVGFTEGGGPLEWFADIAEAIERASIKVRAFFAALAGLPPEVKELAGIGAVVSALAIPFGSMISYVSKAGLELKAFAVAVSALGIPLGTVTLAMAGIGLAILGAAAIFAIAWARSEEFRDKVKASLQMVKDYVTNEFIPKIREIWTALEETLTSVEKLLAEFGLDWGDLGTAIQIATGNIIGFVDLMVGSFRAGIEYIKGELDFMKAKVDLAKDVWGSLSGAIESAWNTIRPVLDSMANAISGLFGNDEGGGISGFFDRWVENIRTGWERVKAALDTVKESFLAFWRGLTINDGTAGDGILGFFERLGQNVRTGWEKVLSILNSVKTAWDDFWRGLLAQNVTSDGVVTAFERIGTSIRSAWDTSVVPVLNFVKEAFSTFWRTAFEVTGTLTDGIGRAFEGVASALRSAWDTKVKPVLEEVKRTFQESLSALFSGTSGGESNAVVEAFGRIGNAIRSAWNDQIKPALDGLKESLNGLWESVRPALDQLGKAWDNIKASWNSAINELKPNIDGLKSTLSGLWDAVRPVFDQLREAWNALTRAFGDGKPVLESIRPIFDRIMDVVGPLTDGWKAMATVVGGALLGSFESFTRILSDVVIPAISRLIEQGINELNAKIDLVKAAWDNVLRPTFEAISSFITNDLIPAFARLLADITTTWNDIRSRISDAWNSIKGDVFEPLMAYLRDTLLAAFTGLKDRVTEVWTAMRDGINSAWTNIRDTVFSPIQAFLRDTLGPAFNTFKDTAVASWNAIRDGISGAWNNIKSQIFDPMVNFVKTTLVQAFDSAKNSIVGIWETLHRGLLAAWDKIFAAGRDKMNSLIDLINAVIDIINKVPFISKIDKLPKVGGPAPSQSGAAQSGRSAFRAVGGPVDGGPPGTDTVPALGPGGTRYFLDNGEHILTRQEVKNAGGHGAIYDLRRQLRDRSFKPYRDGPGLSKVAPPTFMATGGRVDAGNNGLLEEHRNHIHVAMDGPPMSYPKIIEIGNKFPGHSSPTSTYRPGSRGSGGGLDHHSEGRAVDWGGYEQDAFAAFWQSTPGVIELIHRTNKQDYAIFGGGGGGTSNWLQTAAGKLVKIALDKATAPLKAAIDAIPGAGMLPNTMKAIFSGMVEKINSWFESQVASNGPQATGSYGGPPDQAVMQTAFSMARGLGANPKVMLALFEAGFVESGFHNLGHLGSKNDHDSLGFLQQRPSAGWPNPTDVKTATASFVNRAKLVQGLHKTAGSLAQAVQVSAFPSRYQEHRNQAVSALKSLDPAFDPNGYDQGGILPPGPSLAYNFTGRPETVLNPRHSEFVGRVLSGENLLVENHLYVDGEPIRAISRQEVRVREAEKDRIDQTGVRR